MAGNALERTQTRTETVRPIIHVSYADLRKNLATYMDRANDDRDHILVTRQCKEPVVMMAASEFEGWIETVYLLKSLANAKRLRESITNEHRLVYRCTGTGVDQRVKVVQCRGYY